jgi:Flp pilus assembly protein protease CpaA
VFHPFLAELIDEVNAMLTLQILCYFGGIASLAYEDAHYLSVPTRLSDGWLLLMLLLTAYIRPQRLLLACGTIVVLAAFAYLTRGLGSADVIVLTGTAAVWGPTGLLITLLCGSLSCLCWTLRRRTRRAAFIPHLLLGSIITAVLCLLPGVANYIG